MRRILVGAVGAVLAVALAARAEDPGADQAGSAPAGMCRTVVMKPCEATAAGAKKPKKKAPASVRHTAKASHKKRAPAGEQLATKAPATVPAALEVNSADASAATPADSAAPPGGGGVSEPEAPGTRVALDFALLQQTLAHQRWPKQEVSLFGGAPRPPEVMQAGFGLLVERRFAR
jgi:hypothetical protein